MIENQNRREILLVDDDPDYSQLIRTRLEQSGYQVSCVSNGREALELLEGEYQPSLIIMDVDMPDKNGLTTLINMGAQQKIKGENERSKIPVIVATGFESERVRKVIMTQKVSGYLMKPYDSEELIRTVKKLIG